MDASIEVLEKLLLKAKRAEEHIHDLDEAWARFFSQDPYTVSFKDDPKTAQRIYYLSKVSPIPLQFSAFVGDALQNLRSALDHLAHHLVCVGLNASGPFGYVYFPIAKGPSHYKAVQPGKVKGMRQNAIDALDALEPYKGGKGEIFWTLQELNNADKHRLLIPVWTDLLAHSILPTQKAMMARNYLGSNPKGPVPNLQGVTIAPASKKFPLETGDVLLTIPHSEMEENMNFVMSIAFGEPKIVEGKSVIETLQQIAAVVLNLILDFDKLGLLV